MSQGDAAAATRTFLRDRRARLRSGDCECFEGYSGKGCGIQTCANDCSGHGECVYAEDAPFGAVWGDYYTAADSSLTGLGQGPVSFAQKPSWDNGKVRMCVCEAGYSGVDCSQRMCPKGNDVLDERLNTVTALAYQKQNVTLIAAGPLGDGLVKGTTGVMCGNPFPGSDLSTSDGCYDDLLNKTFALTFTSKLNQSFTTKPLVIIDDEAGSASASGATVLASRIESALEELPNYVIDDCEVDCTFTYMNGVNTTEFYPALTCVVEFTGSTVMGPQYLLEVEAEECTDGCTPQLANAVSLKSATRTNTTEDLSVAWASSLHYKKFIGYAQGTSHRAGDAGQDYFGLGEQGLPDIFSFVKEEQTADYNSYECGRRGKCDYSTGECECFEGYMGDRCQTQTALI